MAAIGEGLNITFDIKGIEQVIQDMMGITDDIVKRREIYKILARQAEPVKRAIKAEAPMRKPIYSGKSEIGRTRLGVKYHRADGITYKPGNLKRSIKKFRGKNKMFPTIYVGAQTKKAQGSGYYGYFNQYGTTGARAIKNPKNFVADAGQKVNEQVANRASDALVKYLKGAYSRKFDVGHGKFGI